MTTSPRYYCTTNPADANCKKYNVLSLESVNYRGFMTSEFIGFLELLAYYSARDNYCIPERESGRIAMPELFDLISGSETGAIIAAALNVPTEDKTNKDAFGNTQINKFFANTTSDLFRVSAKKLYVDH